VEKMCAALLQLLPLQDEREALSMQGITYMSDCVVRCVCRTRLLSFSHDSVQSDR
jgi:hypothetical protein